MSLNSASKHPALYSLERVDPDETNTRLLGADFSSQVTFPDNNLARLVCGEYDCHLQRIERELPVTISPRGNVMRISGPKDCVETVQQALQSLYRQLERNAEIDIGDVLGALRMTRHSQDHGQPSLIQTRKHSVSPRTPTQESFIRHMQDHSLVFALGPAGTGKTYLAVAQGVSLLLKGDVERLILSRPAVEAGERLGFLPGDFKEKVDPYLRPIYDALNDMLPRSQLTKKIAQGDIEIAPLAFMRGRSLERAFIILDEAQNATPMQMKMFLTRLGEHARMVITGDPSQIDLPPGERSGLDEAVAILHKVEEVATIYFDEGDVVRHPLVRKIVEAYRHFESRPSRNRTVSHKNPVSKEKPLSSSPVCNPPSRA